MTTLEDQLEHVVEHTHDLLNGPDGDGQLDGTYETERVVLTLPKAFTYLATFLAQLEKRPGEPLDAYWEDAFEKHPQMTEGRNYRRQMRRYLAGVLWNQMQFDLHRLACGQHPSLFTREEQQAALAEDEYLKRF